MPNLNLLNGRSILVLDDEESLRSLLSEGLSARDMHVDCAATLEEALVFLAKRSHDAILCDLNLSKDGTHVSGKVVAERLLAASGERKPAVIHMSGDLIDSSVPRTQNAPRHLQKPFRVSDVLAILLEVFASEAPNKSSG